MNLYLWPLSLGSSPIQEIRWLQQKLCRRWPARWEWHTYVVEASSEQELEEVFASFGRERIGALAIGNDAFFNTSARQLAALSLRYAVPAMHEFQEFAAAGGLVSYGVNIPQTYHQVGLYASRILKGEKAADLPIQQATKLDLVINLKTAKTLGLTVPQTLLVAADEVIE